MNGYWLEQFDELKDRTYMDAAQRLSIARGKKLDYLRQAVKKLAELKAGIALPSPESAFAQEDTNHASR